MFCARWYSSKRKKRRQTRTHVKQKTRDRERANDVSWTFAYTYVLQKKAFASLFIRLSFSCLLLFFLALFFRLSLVLLSSSSSFLSLFVDIRTAIFFVYSMPVTLPYMCVCVCVSVMGEARERERGRQWGGCTMMRNAYVYVCMRALIDYIFYLSTTMMRTRKTRTRSTVAGLLRIDSSFFPSPPFLRFLSNVKIFFAWHHRKKKKKKRWNIQDRWMQLEVVVVVIFLSNEHKKKKMKGRRKRHLFPFTF